MKKPVRYLLFALLWGVVVAYVAYAAATARGRRACRRVGELRIEVEDSTAQGYLVSAQRVGEWIAASGIATVGAPADEVDLAGLESLVARNGFVDRVSAYVAGEGVLHIDIRPRRPLMRLAVDGYDGYLTDEGYYFAAPRRSSLYVPVVTGSYRPPFAADHVGDVRRAVDERLAESEGRIAALEVEKYPFFRRERQNDRNIAELRRMRVKRRWWRLESDGEFDRRVGELREAKKALRRRYRYEARLVAEGIDALCARQQAERRQQKKLEKSYEDFMKLLTFVKFVEEDEFWRSEVVQIVARTTSSGALEVDLIPRSGDFTIRFGRLEGVEERFDKLLRFYREGLARTGWDAWRVVDVRFRGQVVCRR